MLRGQHISRTFGAGPVMGFSAKKRSRNSDLVGERSRNPDLGVQAGGFGFGTPSGLAGALEVAALQWPSAARAGKLSPSNNGSCSKRNFDCWVWLPAPLALAAGSGFGSVSGLACLVAVTCLASCFAWQWPGLALPPTLGGGFGSGAPGGPVGSFAIINSCRFIKANGRFIKANGRFIKANGRFINSGRFIKANGRFIKANGRFIKANGRFIKANGRFIKANGRFINNGQLIKAYQGFSALSAGTGGLGFSL